MKHWDIYQSLFSAGFFRLPGSSQVLAGLLGVEQVPDVHSAGLGVVQAALLPAPGAQGAATSGAALLGRWIGGLLGGGDWGVAMGAPKKELGMPSLWPSCRS